MQGPIYMDYNATTPLDRGVLKEMMPFLETWTGNPSSVHQAGQKVRAFLDEGRYRVAELWGCKPSEVVFTSGGTESNNMAICGAARLARRQGKGNHLVTTAIEHHAVLHCMEYLSRCEGFELTVVPSDSEGRVAEESVLDQIRRDTVLVSMMAANNEVGTLQNVSAVGEGCRERGVLFHTDAVQWFGKAPVGSIHDFRADLVSVCAHKFYGPKGAGILFTRSPLLPDPILWGGGHENERRAGTENVAGIMGMVGALERFTPKPVFESERLSRMTDQIRAGIRGIPGVRLLASGGGDGSVLCNTVAFSVQGCDGMTLMAALDMEGVCASSGAACSAGSLEPSHVLRAMIGEESEREGLVRLSLGRETTEEEVTAVLEILVRIIPPLTRLGNG